MRPTPPFGRSISHLALRREYHVAHSRETASVSEYERALGQSEHWVCAQARSKGAVRQPFYEGGLLRSIKLWHAKRFTRKTYCP